MAGGGRTESERVFMGQTAQRPQNHVRHVISDHPWTDQNITERPLARPLGTVSHLREAVSGLGPVLCDVQDASRQEQGRVCGAGGRLVRGQALIGAGV